MLRELSMKKMNLKGRTGPPSSARTRPQINARMEAYWNNASGDMYGWAEEPTYQNINPYYANAQPKLNYSNTDCHCACSCPSCPDYDRGPSNRYGRRGSLEDRISYRVGPPEHMTNKGVCADTLCGSSSSCCLEDVTPDYLYESLTDEEGDKDYRQEEDEDQRTTTFSLSKAISFLNSETNHLNLKDTNKKPSKLKRRQAYYRERKQGRSRSLTHIDRMDPTSILDKDETDCRSEPPTLANEQLLLPVPSESEARHQRRKKLTGSQVSSSEYFSVHFEDELGSRYEEFLPATRGVSIGDALRPLLERQHLTIGKVDIFLEPSSKTPLPSPSATDTYFVAGKSLFIKPKTKQQDSKFHCRSFKESTRKRTQRTKGGFFGGSTEDQTSNVGSPVGGATLETLGPTSPHCVTWTQQSVTRQVTGSSASASHEGSLKVKQSKQSNRWSGLFSNSAKDNSKMDLLAEQLNNYSLHGIPGSTLSDDQEDEGKYVLEEDVRSIVHGWDDLSERAQKQQTAIWELVETEVVYLKTVKVITDLFLVCLYNLQTKNILNEIDREKLFSNIPEIYASNRCLWLQSLYPMVHKARTTREPLLPSELRNGFLEFGGTCSPYIRYCLDQTKCQRYCREKYHENELFKAYLAWCETRKECNRLRLMDILVRPMQRMTKYSLLLKAILKHTESQQERQDLEEMIVSVETFVLSVNGALRNRQEAERLKGISDRIEAYEAVETREEELESVVRAHSSLDLFHPMPGCGAAGRAFLFEGDLKVKDANTKIDAHCFLFTDMFLVCKSTGRKAEKVKVVRPPFPVDRIVPKELSRDPSAFGIVCLNEYGTACAALTLHATDNKMVKTWLDNIKKAQKLFLEAKRKETTDFVGDSLEDQEPWNANFLTSRSPRDFSSYTSQLSSLVHSHSGSIEMNEASNVPSRGVSFEHEHRASSFSSDDAGNGGGDSHKGRSPCAEGVPARTSPRAERRTFLSKSPTPNRLSVKVPSGSLSGQSLPNLSSASESLPQTYSIHSLVVPKGLLSPTHRGVSYPPPSPRNLTRSEALTGARNPPLIKSRNISSTEVAKSSFDIQVPNLKSGAPCTDSVQAGTDTGLKFSKTDSTSPEEELNCVGGCPPKRLTRSERSDMKRYYTAGAIEDIKKEVMKDSSIYKRLSWNCGAQQSDCAEARPLASADPLRSQQFFSIESMRSSSGVSSTTSLFLCGVSDLERNTETHHPPPSAPPGGEYSVSVSSTCSDFTASSSPKFTVPPPPQTDAPPPPPPTAAPPPPKTRNSQQPTSISSSLPSTDSFMESSHL